MAVPISSASSISSAWQVLLLFVIPIGGGIPAGVLLARSRGLGWPEMEILYFISDIILACVFEPLMLLVIEGAKRSTLLARWREAYRKAMSKTYSFEGKRLGPFSLVMVAFGIDPMTGRTAAAAAGHGFVTGWMLAITGDMLFFTLIMISTLWLNNLLGDGTWTTVIIMVVMLAFPPLVRRIRERIRSRKAIQA